MIVYWIFGVRGGGVGVQRLPDGRTWIVETIGL